jgi:hypothetical protein
MYFYDEKFVSRAEDSCLTKHYKNSEAELLHHRVLEWNFSEVEQGHAK